MRIDYIISIHLQCKARAPLCRAALNDGRVTVVDAWGVATVVSDPSFQVVVGAEWVHLDGLRLPRPFQRIIALHKAVGCDCGRGSVERPDAFMVADAIEACGLRHPDMGAYGRLDINSSGLVLCGTDGGLHTILHHPVGRVPKTYQAQCSKSRYERSHLKGEFAPSVVGPLDADAEERFADGLVLDDARGTRCAAGAVLTRVDELTVEVTLSEGMHHQVKRMIGAVGGALVALHRLAIGPVRLGHLGVGEAREVTDEELRQLARLIPFHLRTAESRAAWSGDTDRPTERTQRAKKRRSKSARGQGTDSQHQQDAPGHDWDCSGQTGPDVVEVVS